MAVTVQVSDEADKIKPTTGQQHEVAESMANILITYIICPS
jgi:hypothetical protein